MRPPAMTSRACTRVWACTAGRHSRWARGGRGPCSPHLPGGWAGRTAPARHPSPCRSCRMLWRHHSASRRRRRRGGRRGSNAGAVAGAHHPAGGERLWGRRRGAGLLVQHCGRALGLQDTSLPPPSPLIPPCASRGGCCSRLSASDSLGEPPALGLAPFLFRGAQYPSPPPRHPPPSPSPRSSPSGGAVHEGHPRRPALRVQPQGGGCPAVRLHPLCKL